MVNMIPSALSFVSVICALIVVQGQDVLVNTTYGTLRGLNEKLYDGKYRQTGMIPRDEKYSEKKGENMRQNETSKISET